MQLQLIKIIPEPLKARMGQQSSDIWGKEQCFDSGEKIMFRAPSGKGKSTFIHILYGIRKDYEGQALWAATDVRNAGSNQLSLWRSKQLSIVFQDLRLFNDLTVEENLLLKNNLQQDVKDDRIKDWLGFLGLQQKWQQKAETLSYGERQRVAIVRSLLQPFDWLLLDEPFSHLDNDNIIKATKLIQECLAERNAGLLLVDLEDNDWFAYDRKMLL